MENIPLPPPKKKFGIGNIVNKYYLCALCGTAVCGFLNVKKDENKLKIN